MRDLLKKPKKEYFKDDPSISISEISVLSEGDNWKLIAYYKKILKEHKDPFKKAPRYFIFKGYRLKNELYDINEILTAFEKHVMYRPNRKSPTNRKAIKHFYGFCLYQGVDWMWWLNYLWHNLLMHKEQPVLSHLTGDEALELWNDYNEEHGHPHNHYETHDSMKVDVFTKMKRRNDEQTM